MILKIKVLFQILSVLPHEWDGLHKLSKSILTIAFEKDLIEKVRFAF